MLVRAITAGVPCGWFAADSGYGRDPDLRAFCHDHALAYVLAVPMDLPLLDARGQALSCQDILTDRLHRWERRSAGAGSKGHRLYDWAMHEVRVKGQDPVDLSVVGDSVLRKAGITLTPTEPDGQCAGVDVPPPNTPE